MSIRATFHLSDFAKIMLIISVLATAGGMHLYENRGVSRIGNVNGNEMTDTLEWLDQFYASPQGLQRPAGLVKDGHIDLDGISQWLFRMYLEERSREADPWTARALWRRPSVERLSGERNIDLTSASHFNVFRGRG
jgi:hypothetical protein